MQNFFFIIINLALIFNYSTNINIANLSLFKLSFLKMILFTKVVVFFTVLVILPRLYCYEIHINLFYNDLIQQLPSDCNIGILHNDHQQDSIPQIQDLDINNLIQKLHQQNK